MRTIRLTDVDELLEHAEDHRYLRGVSPGYVAAKLGVTRVHVHRLCKDRKLDAVRLVSHSRELLAILITRESVEAYERHRRESAAA